MAYKPAIPAGTDKLSNSQPDIQGNFTEINTYLMADHTAFNIGADQGKHVKVTLPVGVPAVVGANELGLYSAIGASSGQPELFINKNTYQVPATEYFDASPGWTWLPSGVLMQWGHHGGGGVTPVTVNFAKNFPTHVFSVVVTVNTAATGKDIIALVSISQNNFVAQSHTLNGTANNVPFYWIALGD